MMIASLGSFTANTSTMISTRPPTVSTMSLMIVHESKNPLGHLATTTFPGD